MTRVPIDEIFTWREEFGRKAKEVFGGHRCDVSPQTFSDMKDRCDRIAAEEFGENRFRDLMPIPLNGIQVHMVYGLEDGFVFPCDCANRKE